MTLQKQKILISKRIDNFMTFIEKELNDFISCEDLIFENIAHLSQKI